jgi:hypothetical protein
VDGAELGSGLSAQKCMTVKKGCAANSVIRFPSGTLLTPPGGQGGPARGGASRPVDMLRVEAMRATD